MEHCDQRTRRRDFPSVALIYDFDGTLARGNLQEQTFIPDVLGIGKNAFWNEVKCIAKREDADEILVYMHLMIEKTEKAKKEVTRKMLREHGRKAELFPGLGMDAGSIEATLRNGRSD